MSNLRKQMELQTLAYEDSAGARLDATFKKRLKAMQLARFNLNRKMQRKFPTIEVQSSWELIHPEFFKPIIVKYDASTLTFAIEGRESLFTIPLAELRRSLWEDLSIRRQANYRQHSQGLHDALAECNRAIVDKAEARDRLILKWNELNTAIKIFDAKPKGKQGTVRLNG